MAGKVLFIDSVHQELQAQLESDGWTCIDGTEWTREHILSTISTYTGAVIRSRFKLDETFMKAATSLKFIARAGAGMENIDIAAAERAGIICVNAPEGNRNAVAEHAMGLLLALFNNIVKADNEVRRGLWLREENRGIELEGKTISLIGFGNTGSTMARKLSGFNCRILAVDPYIKIDSSLFPYVEQVTLQHALAESQIISLHVPLTDETRYMVNTAFIETASQNFYLINTSRGKVVSIDALVKGLQSGKIIGAGLDVLEFESVSFENLSEGTIPESFSKLLEMPRVVLSPHVAGWTYESHRKISEVLASKIKAITF